MVNTSQVSSDQNPTWLGYTGDEKLLSYIGIVISQYKDPGTLTNQDDSWFMSALAVLITTQVVAWDF